jgi:hypothetical protein
MNHLAIMNPRWHSDREDFAGRENGQSRWYRNKIAPWKKISAGDTVFQRCWQAGYGKSNGCSSNSARDKFGNEGLARRKFKELVVFSASAFPTLIG